MSSLNDRYQSFVSRPRASRDSLFFFVLAIVLGAASASAQTVDQMQLEANQNRAVLPGSATGQTFTPTVAGYFAGIEISAAIHPAGQPLHTEIWADGKRAGYLRIEPEDAGGTPLTLDPDEITGTYLDFTPFAVASVPGEVLELRSWTTEATLLTSLRVATTNVYPDGTMTIDGEVSGGDLAFKSFVTGDLPSGDYDQIQPDGVDLARALLPTSATGQTVTVGQTGRLRGLELSLDAPPAADDDLYLEIFRHGEGAPVSEGQVVLTPQQILATEPPLFLYEALILGTYVDLHPLDIEVTAGEVIEFRLSTSNSVGLYSARTASTNAYADGHMTIDGAPSGGDMVFKLFVFDPLFFDGFESGDLSGWSSFVD